MSEITRILSAIEQGDPHAAEQLLPLVYDELRKLATQKMAQEKPGQTLDATALVHEAYIRLAAAPLESPPLQGGATAGMRWNSRGHFFAAAAEAMRRILVENARRKQRIRHGGGRKRIDLEGVGAAGEPGDDRLVALDDALGRLAEEDAAAAEVVKLRYFAGLTIRETSEALGISIRTANRHWAYAKAWLYRELSEAGINLR
jgi:RNA polymerase sigma factor (TIGR02999 family)